VPFLALFGAYRELLSAFGASMIDNFSAIFSGHTFAKAMFAAAFQA
jgi:hypothetical protein